MDPYRASQPHLLPLQQSRQSRSLQQNAAAEQVGLNEPLRPKPTTRERHTREEWEAIKPALTELLLCYSLADAMKEIKRTHSFDAG